MELAGVQPDSDEQWRQYKADLDAHRLFRRFCYAARASFGDEYLVLVSGKPIINNIGEFRGYRGIASNVTEAVSVRHRAEAAELPLQDAVDNISDGFAIYDRDDRFVMCNQCRGRYRHDYG